MFERGKEYERGRSPLSPKLPSPAINICDFLPVIPAGDGCNKMRGAAPSQILFPIYTGAFKRGETPLSFTSPSQTNEKRALNKNPFERGSGGRAALINRYENEN